VSEEHSRINMTEYKARAAKLEKRMCETHADVEYSLGCKVCLKLLCTQCVPAAGVCDDGRCWFVFITYHIHYVYFCLFVLFTCYIYCII